MKLEKILLVVLCTAFVQLNHCRKLSTNYISGNRFVAKFRNANAADLSQIAELCSTVSLKIFFKYILSNSDILHHHLHILIEKTFDGPFEWHQLMDQRKSVRNYLDQLTDRFDLVSGGYKVSVPPPSVCISLCTDRSQFTLIDPSTPWLSQQSLYLQTRRI